MRSFNCCGLLLLILCLSFNGEAQKFEVGGKIAGTLNDSYGIGTDTYISTPGYGLSAGGYLTYFLSGNIRARAELALTSRIFQYESSSFKTANSGFGQQAPLGPTTAQSSIYGSTHYSMNKRAIYMDVPVGLDYEVMPRVVLQAGGMLSFFLREYKNTLSNSSTVNAQKSDDINYYQPMQVSVYVGGAYRFDFGLSAGVRGVAGVTNTFVSSTKRADSQIFPISLQIFVSYPLLRF
jgi:hypothetical protein